MSINYIAHHGFRFSSEDPNGGPGKMIEAQRETAMHLMKIFLLGLIFVVFLILL